MIEAESSRSMRALAVLGLAAEGELAVDDGAAEARVRRGCWSARRRGRLANVHSAGQALSRLRAMPRLRL